MFAIARTAGWVAHWSEMISDPEMKIARPRQLYTGPTRRDYVAGQEALVGAFAAEQALDFAKRRAAHRPAVHRSRRRLADAVQRKDRRVHLVLAGREAHGRERLDLVALHAEAPLARTRAGCRDRAATRATVSGVSANRCSVMSLCAVAVPEAADRRAAARTRTRSRIASSAVLAHRRRSSLAWASGTNRRWCSASAASISVFFGSTARSVTPKRSAALRLATP